MNYTRGYLDKGKSEHFFAFLAAHRDHLKTWVLGGTHLILIVAWDTKGKKDHDDR